MVKDCAVVNRIRSVQYEFRPLIGTVPMKQRYPSLELTTLIITLALNGVPGSLAADWKVYYGNLHSHTSASDGVDTASIAYAWARNEGHLNFLCLSEHNYMVTPAGLAGDQTAADASSTADFVGLVGQEFSTLPTNGGNHVNIHNVLTVIPEDRNNDYRFIYHDFLPKYTNDHPGAIIVCQFNHPENPNRDYGVAAIGSFPNYQGEPSAFLREAGAWVKLIAVISGPADSNMKKTDTPP